MAGVLLNHLRAASKFLRSVQGENQTQALAMQQKVVEDGLASLAALQMDEAGEIMAVLREIPWRAEVLAGLESKVTAKASSSSLGTCLQQSKSQDFTAIVNYYTPKHWQGFLSQDPAITPAMKEKKLLSLPQELGMQQGTEPTYQVLAALHLISSDGLDSAMRMTPAVKHQVYCYVKKVVQKKNGERANLQT